jgi:hypothetical protein
MIAGLTDRLERMEDGKESALVKKLRLASLINFLQYDFWIARLEITAAGVDELGLVDILPDL